jgi:hypothetical protein
VFGIKSKTGDIYVAKDLDFEAPPNVSERKKEPTQTMELFVFILLWKTL